MSAVPNDTHPGENDFPYEEEILRSPFSLRSWWRYLMARSGAPLKTRSAVYELALKALPGSYKLWHAYLQESLERVRNLPVTHPQFETLNNTFELALVTMHKMPKIWIMYLQTLTDQKLLTRTRRAFDRALRALPVTQHGRIWEQYMAFVGQKGVPIETKVRVFRRYLRYDPSHFEDFMEFIVSSETETLARVLNDDDLFVSVKGKTKHGLWLEVCELLAKHANEVLGLNVDSIIRAGIRRFSYEVGGLWTCLAEYYIRKKLPEKARGVFEEGMASVVTVRDFGVIFDAYSQFEESMLLAYSMEEGDVCAEFWLDDDDDVDLRLARLENLIKRRPELVSSVVLRQNPHNVEQWHRRVKLFEGNPAEQVLTYTQAVRTVDPMKAVGKPHTLWVAFAKMYEKYKDIDNARVIFDRAVQVNFKTVDHLASVWCEWAEMELRHKNSVGAFKLMLQATALPSVEVRWRVAADGNNEPVQMRLHRSLQLWSFYADLEESFGTLDTTREAYEKILDLGIATPRIIINYAVVLEEHKYFEEAFKVYERGVKVFKYPHVKDIWVTYLSKFVKRYGKSKLERARELYENAIETAPAECVTTFYLQYAKLEEDYGLAMNAMKVYYEATKAVPADEKLRMYEIYISKAAEVFGVPKTREVYEQVIHSGLPDKDVKGMCLKYADLETSLGEIDRSRSIFTYASKFSDPRTDAHFWKCWYEFEARHGNLDTFRDMLRIKRSVSASYSQVRERWC